MNIVEKNKKSTWGGGYFNNRKVIIPILVLLLILVIGTSFALWQLTFTQSGTNVITTGCLRLTLTDDTDAINLTDATPTTDEEGRKLTPYTFTLTNTCTTESAYAINLETVSSGDKILADQYVKANLLKAEEEVFIDKLVESHQNEEKVITEASRAYMLTNGKLAGNESIQFSLRLWMTEETEALDDVMNATWQGKITVTASYVPKEVTAGKELYSVIMNSAALDNTSSEFVSSASGIDFAKAPSNTNGKGVYTIADTKDDKYPVHYFRGNVTNNNVKFANFCWKIVRTTETGGVKLIYNGTPNSDGGCTNTTGESTQIGTSAFNSNKTSPADVGYMYGTRYTTNSKSEPSTAERWVYGNDVDYIDGKYVLKNTAIYSTSNFKNDKGSGFNAHRYTCFSTSATCESVNYLYYNEEYIILTGGKKVDDVFSEMLTESSNENSSTIKTAIDTWYQNNMTDFTSYLEDTVWCNDRSIYEKNGWDKDSTSGGYLYFSGRERGYFIHKPSIECSNPNDRFTVSSEVGNRKLTYPVALLTADEAAYAGHGTSGYSNSSYLYTNEYWWLLTAEEFFSNKASVHDVSSIGMLSNFGVHNSSGVRPSVSLAPGTIVSETTDGTPNNPYEVVAK